MTTFTPDQLGRLYDAADDEFDGALHDAIYGELEDDPGMYEHLMVNGEDLYITLRINARTVLDAAKP